MTAVCLLFSLPIAAQTETGEIAGHKVRVPGEKVEGTTAKLTEVEAEMVARLAPQEQAERLLQYAISHHIGATDEIKARVSGWRGVIGYTGSLQTLVEVAINGDDLRVRAAAWEVTLAAFNIAKTSQQVDMLLQQVAANPVAAQQQIWHLGLLANRGVETARIHAELRQLTHAPEIDVRLRAIEAIAHIGTDETVQDLVQAFHHDPAFDVRIQGGGCGLAHCGMLTRAQRMQAVPGLITMVEDSQLDSETRKYDYRALKASPTKSCLTTRGHGATGTSCTAPRQRTGFARSRSRANRAPVSPERTCLVSRAGRGGNRPRGSRDRSTS